MKFRIPLFLLVILLSPGAVQAQDPLDDVEALLGQGEIFLARELLQDWWEGQLAAANRMDQQRSIWLRGLLTVDPSMAELDFRRLALEFPGGPFSDHALLRLAQSAEMRGDLRQAIAHYKALERDYPSSRLRGRAQAWLRMNSDSIQVLGPITYPGTETDPGPILPVEEATNLDESQGSFSVQAGAFRNIDGARSFADDLREFGHLPRLVRIPVNNLIRVRVGRFSDRDEASHLQRELVGVGFEAVVVSDANLEEEVR